MQPCRRKKSPNKYASMYISALYKKIIFITAAVCSESVS